MKGITNRFKSAIIIITIIFTAIPIFADTIYLNDNVIITGKILKQNNKYYIKNSYGTFSFNKKSVNKIIITKNYKEDIKFYEKLKIKADEKQIKIDYEAGVDISEADISEVDNLKEEKKKRKYKKHVSGSWNFGRITFSMAYFTALESKDGKLISYPVGIGANVGYEQGLEFKHRHFMIPGIKIEHSHIFFSKTLFEDESIKLMGYSINVGLMWAFPGLTSDSSNMILSVLPGSAFLFRKNDDTSISQLKEAFSLKTSIGYEHQFNPIALQILFNYNYLLAKSDVYHCLGLSIGLGIKI